MLLIKIKLHQPIFIPLALQEVSNATVFMATFLSVSPCPALSKLDGVHECPQYPLRLGAFTETGGHS